MDCARLHDVAPELALGILSGQERAAALAHLENCPACQAEVEKMAAVADGLVSLAPDIEPPVGFEHRVMDALAPVPATVGGGARRGYRRWIAVAGVVAAAFGGGGWALGATVSGPPAAAPADAMLVASLTSPAPPGGAGAAVGRVWAYWGKSAWMFMSIDDPAAVGVVSCQLVRTDGTVVPVGSFAVEGGYGWWGVPLTVPRSAVREAQVVDSSGRVLASAPL